MEVRDLVAGQVVEMGYDPEAGQLHWLRRPVPVTWVLVECTVVSNTPVPGTALPGGLTQQDGATVYQPSRPVLHDLKLLHNGRGWRIQPRANARVVALAAHHPVCADCGELWPCREQRLDLDARAFTRQLDDLCAHCGEPIRGAWNESFFDGVTRRRYHVAKKYRGPDGRPCVTALTEAKRSIPGQPGSAGPNR